MRAFKVILGSMATFLGLVATGLFISAAMRPEVTNSESRGFKSTIMGWLFVLALFCFGVAGLSLGKLKVIAWRFSLRTLLIALAVVAVLLGLIAISSNSPAPSKRRPEFPATVNGSFVPMPIHLDFWPSCWE